MESKTILYIVLSNFVVTVLLVLFLIFGYSHFKNEKQIVYVDNIELFSEFNMAKDLNKINESEIKKQKKKLDSLYGLYNIYKENNKLDKLEPIEEQLRNEDRNLKSLDEYLSNDLNRKVWKRLNGYIKEFGEQKDYDIIIGTQGNGNVMYAKEMVDVTTDVLNYSNTKYEGNQ